MAKIAAQIIQDHILYIYISIDENYEMFFWAINLQLTSQAFVELNYEMKAQRYNPRFFHTYLDEDMIGTVKGLARRCHVKMMELRILMRWQLRLAYYTRH